MHRGSEGHEGVSPGLGKVLMKEERTTGNTRYILFGVPEYPRSVKEPISRFGHTQLPETLMPQVPVSCKRRSLSYIRGVERDDR